MGRLYRCIVEDCLEVTGCVKPDFEYNNPSGNWLCRFCDDDPTTCEKRKKRVPGPDDTYSELCIECDPQTRS